VDNPTDGNTVNPRAPSCRFGPDRRLSAATGALTLIAAVGAVLTNDPGGRILFAGAALLLLAYTVSDLVWWPRLAVSADGLVVSTPGLSVRLNWADVEAVRPDTRQRLGLRSVTLELDAGEHLVVFSRRALGADPEAVAGLIQSFDPRRPDQG
jgi:hypothetical protein